MWTQSVLNKFMANKEIMDSTFHNSKTTDSIVSKVTAKTTPIQKFVKTGRFEVKPQVMNDNEKKNFLMDLKLD